ncbi:hypothetical protein BJV74DRAFT_289401 [Russula compacta]|nr:hypothetical protein BJV74DRAFT_289401 [Russula compacta]
MISICFTCIDQNFEQVGQPFVLEFAINHVIGHTFIKAKEAYPTILRDVNNDQLEVWKINNPVRKPPKHYNTSSSFRSAHPTTGSNETLLTLLDGIRRSSDLSPYAEFLDNRERITDCFEEDPERRVQAILLYSRKRKHKPSSSVPSRIRSLREDRIGGIQQVAALSHPSDCLGEAGRKLREKIFIGRPENLFGYPNAIFHPHLAKLQYNLERLQRFDYDSEEISSTEREFLGVSDDFRGNALKDYDKAAARWSNAREFFVRIFGNTCQEQKWIHRSDDNKKVAAIPVLWGTVQDEDENRVLPHVILETKKEKGCGEPTMQCVKYYARSCQRYVNTKFFHSTLFPVILIGLNGHSLEISTALTLERIVINQLLILDLKDDFDHNTTLRKLVGIASALAECASQLESEYMWVMQHNSPVDRYPPCFPQPTLDPRSPSSSLLPVLTYEKRLNNLNHSFQLPNNPSADTLRSLFVAKLVRDESAQDSVVVKFTPRYNEEAHRLLAEHGLAPKLYACHRVIGKLFMVVMERLRGNCLEAVTMRQAFNREGSKRPLKATVFEDITEAVKLLQEHNLVHGDFRAVNIMIDPSGERAKLIDFDWAGKSGTSRYPLRINKQALSDEWHPDVKPDGVMEMDHDTFALDSVLKPHYMDLVQSTVV